jgi:hypothetical protein
MTGGATTLPRPLTLNVISVGTKLYEVLGRHVATRPEEPVFYGDFLKQARALFRDDEEMKHAVPIRIGMKRVFVRTSGKPNGYQNLACAVNKSKQTPCIPRPWDCDQKIREVVGFDWSSVKAASGAYVARAITVATSLRNRRETTAREPLFAHFRENGAAHERFNNSNREPAISLPMESISLNTGSRTARQAKDALD